MYTNGPVYSKLLADHYGATLVNAAAMGSSNNRIFRTSTRDLLGLLETNKPEDIVVLIGLTNTYRGDYWNTDPSLSSTNDGHFVSFTSNEKHEYAKKYTEQWYRMYDQEAAVTELLQQLVLFTSFLKHNKLKYLIWSNSNSTKPINFNEPFVKDFYRVVDSDPNIIKLFDFNFCDYALANGFKPWDRDGHPGKQAHNLMYEWLLKTLPL